MESLLPRILILLFTFNAYAFENSVFKMNAPIDRTEEPKMFGSDVMFLKKAEPGEGGIFVKYIINDKAIKDPKAFLLEKVKSSKSMTASQISKIDSKHGFIFITFKDKNEDVIALMKMKNDTSYVFVMMKGAEKSSLFESLKTFKFH